MARVSNVIQDRRGGSKAINLKGSSGALLVDGIFATRFLRRVEYAVRQGLAVGIACIWVLIPRIASPFSRVAFLAAVLALISCNENFGRTIRSGVLCLLAAVAGALLVTAWHEAVGTSYGASWGGVALFSFLLTYPRFDPLALKIAQVLNVSSLITFHLTPTLPWYFPFQTAAACAVGCGSAIIALVLPYPRAASAEAKTRVATAAKVSTAIFSSLVESYTALSDERATFMQLQAAYLMQSADLNLGWFQAVVSDLSWEPWVRRRWSRQVAAYVQLTKELTTCLRGMHRAVTDWDLQNSAHNPLKSKMAAALRRLGMCTGYSLGHEAALLRGAHHDPPDVAAAGGACLEESVLSDFLHDLQLAREYAYYREPYTENGQVVFPNAPLWGMLASSFFLFHAYQYACAIHKAQVALAQLGEAGAQRESSAGEDEQAEAEEGQADDPAPQKGGPHVVARKATSAAKAVWAGLVAWWAPDGDKVKEAVRRTAALVCAGIVGLALSPYGLWAAIAAAFVGGQRIGGSFNTALNRLQGSVAGAVAGFLLLLAVRKVPAVIGVTLALWVAVSGYVRTNAEHGYGGLVGGFTAIVIMLGQPPDIPRATLETYAFTRLYEQCIGILFVVLFDYALWPARAVKLIHQEATANMNRLGELWSLLLEQYLDAHTLEHRRAAVVDIIRLEATITASVAKQKQLAKDAAQEPQLWHAPFPEAPWQSLIAGQESAVRLMGTVRRTMSVRTSEVLAEQMGVLVQPLRPQLEVLGQEIQATFMGLVAGMGGRPAAVPGSLTTQEPPQRSWRTWLHRLRPRRGTSGDKREEGSRQEAVGEQAGKGPGTANGAPPASLPVSLSGLSSASSAERSSRTADTASLEDGSPHSTGPPVWPGPEPVRTWSMPHLVVNVAALSPSGSSLGENKTPLARGHRRQGTAPQGTRSEGNTPRPQRSRPPSYSQRVVDEIDARIAAIEREEEEKAERQRARRASLDRQCRDGGGSLKQRTESMEHSRTPHAVAPLGKAAQAALSVEVVVGRGGQVELAARPPAGGGSASELSCSPSPSSDGSTHARQFEAWNEVSIQGGAVPDLVLGERRTAAAQAGAGAAGAEGPQAGEATTRGGSAVRPQGTPEGIAEKGGWTEGGGLEEEEEQADAGESKSSGQRADGAELDGEGETEADGEAPDVMVGPTLRERRQRALAGLQRRYEAVIQGLIAARRAEPETPLLGSEALLHFNTLMYTMRLLIGEAEKMEKAIREGRQMSRPIRLGTIAQLPYDVAVKREAAYDQDPVTQLLGPGPTPSALWRHRINEEADEGKDD